RQRHTLQKAPNPGHQGLQSLFDGVVVIWHQRLKAHVGGLQLLERFAVGAVHEGGKVIRLFRRFISQPHVLANHGQPLGLVNTGACRQPTAEHAMQLRGVAERLVCGKHVGPAFKFSRTGGGGIGFGHEAAVSLNRWCTFRYVPGRSPDEYRILAFWGNPGTNTRADGVAFLFRHTENVITYQIRTGSPMRRIVMSRLTVALASAMLAPLPANAADNPGAHQHGHAELQIAIDTNTADVFLRSPAYNLLGFEHEPHTEQQHQQLADLEQWAASTPLINIEDGSCNVEEASFHSSWPNASSHQESHAHDHEHPEHEGQDN